ncbi:hypothetical protein MGR01S_25100 [Meiothermus granaticius NBRC 107808]|nr:hypothetical protein MGR01S_25100 [Meiothermus granaticius NBRC 107808]
MPPPPPAEPWPSEGSLQQEEDSPSPPEPSRENLLEDPRFQQLVRLFGGRLRKVQRETPPTPELEASDELNSAEE